MTVPLPDFPGSSREHCLFIYLGEGLFIFIYLFVLFIIFIYLLYIFIYFYYLLIYFGQGLNPHHSCENARSLTC
uniref:hypothetical protein n=1 Tax=Salmonella sp. s60131 TaxID=3159722 RepID=UPI00397EE622